MSLAEQIKALEEARDNKVQLMNNIIEKSAKEGRTMDENEVAEFDEYEADVDSIEADLTRLKAMEKRLVKSATTVSGKSEEEGTKARAGLSITVSAPKEEKGVLFGRFVKNFAASKGNLMMVERLAEAEAKKTGDNRILNLTKAAVSAGSTSDPSWIGVLAPEEKTIITDFIEFLRPKTIIGQFGQNNIPSLRSVPFNTTIVGQVSGGKGQWVGEGKGKPLTKWGYDSSSLHPLKVAAIAVLTQEALRNGSVAIDMLVRDELAKSLQEVLDEDFINPAKNGVDNVSPSSITYGATKVESSGSSVESIEKDFQSLWYRYVLANLDPANAVYIMSAVSAMHLSELRDEKGNYLYPDLTLTGGSIKGVPVLVSQYAKDVVVLMSATEVYLGDEDGVLLDMSTEASLEMSDTPTQDGISGKGAELVSLWQTNLVGIRAERIINWKRRRKEAVAYISDVKWGVPGGTDSGTESGK